MLNALRRTARSLPRPWKRALTMAFDFVALLFVLWLSYRLRLGEFFWPTQVQVGLMLIAPLIAIPIFMRLGLYRAVIRYLPDRAMIVIAQAMFLATAVWVTILFLTEMYGIKGVPRSIPLIYFALGSLIIGGSRFGVKQFLVRPRGGDSGRTRVLIWGADNAGMQLASALNASGSRVVAGFIDANRAIWGSDVMGVRVYSPGMTGDVVKNLGVAEVILSMPSLPGSSRQEIYRSLSRFDVKISTLPAIADIAAGKYVVGALREIDIDDLLGRSSVPANPDLLRSMIAGRVILVSGAGGSIGSELVRLIGRWNPEKLLLLEANEFALYEIARKMGEDAAPVNIVPVLGSVTDIALIRRVFAAHEVEVVFHAAAHKHVPLLEANPLEGVRNNVFGTATIARAALAAGVANFVLISTDKAVHPTSVMGATKRWAELIIRDCANSAAAGGSNQKFCAVRFGNVLGSNGSVVPLFREQIAKGGPVTVTSDEMTRYFMSVHEAAELIVQAGALSEGGDIFLLEMGEPVRIRDLAENMVRLAGLSLKQGGQPGGDIEIRVVGARPGEKLKEELFYDPAQAAVTAQPRILRARTALGEVGALDARLAELAAALHGEDAETVRKVLFAYAIG